MMNVLIICARNGIDSLAGWNDSAHICGHINAHCVKHASRFIYSQSHVQYTLHSHYSAMPCICQGAQTSNMLSALGSRVVTVLSASWTPSENSVVHIVGTSHLPAMEQGQDECCSFATNTPYRYYHISRAVPKTLPAFSSRNMFAHYEPLSWIIELYEDLVG